jgi:hypothetical protein
MGGPLVGGLALFGGVLRLALHAAISKRTQVRVAARFLAFAAIECAATFSMGQVQWEINRGKAERLAAAIEAFRDARGVLPGRVEEVVPEFVDELPRMWIGLRRAHLGFVADEGREGFRILLERFWQWFGVYRSDTRTWDFFAGNSRPSGSAVSVVVGSKLGLQRIWVPIGQIDAISPQNRAVMC